MQNKSLYIVCLFLISHLFWGCSFQTAGTGHEGEAKIVGTLVDSENNPVEECSLTVALSSYVPEASDSRAKSLLGPVKIGVGTGGAFSFDVYEGAEYTISGIKGDELIYMPGISITKGDKTLGSISLEKGVSVEINPWWESDSDSNIVAVQGTDWVYNIATEGTTKLIWPEETLKLYHYGDDGIDTQTVHVKGGMVIGDSIVGNPPKFSIGEDTVFVGMEVKLFISSYKMGDIYRVDWGDFQDTIYKESAFHFYDSLIEESTQFVVEVIKLGELDSSVWIDMDTGFIDKDSMWDDSLKKRSDHFFNMDFDDKHFTDSIWDAKDLFWWKLNKEGIVWTDSVNWYQPGQLDTLGVWYKKNVARDTVVVINK